MKTIYFRSKWFKGRNYRVKVTNRKQGKTQRCNFMMDAGEIIRSYKLAKQPDEQITILAELNAEDWTDEAIADMECKIVNILRDGGVLKESQKVQKILQRVTREERRKTFVFFSGFVADCLTAIDKVSPKEQALYLGEIEEVREYVFENQKG